MFKGGENLKQIDVFPVSVRAARANAGMTQNELAAVLNVHPKTLVKWEANNYYPDSNNLLTLSRISGVPLDCIFLSMSLPKVDHPDT